MGHNTLHPSKPVRASFVKITCIIVWMFPDHPHACVCMWSCIAGRQLLPLSAFSALMHPGTLWVCWKWFPDPSYKMTWRFCSCKLLASCKHTEWNSNAVPEQPNTYFSVTSLVLSLSYVLSSWLHFLMWMGVRCIKIAFPGYWIVVDFSHIPTVLFPSLRSCVVCESIKMGVRWGCLAQLSLGMV